MITRVQKMGLSENDLELELKEITFESCHFPGLSALEETQKAHLCKITMLFIRSTYLCQGHLTQRDLSGSISISPRWRGPPA